MLFFLRFSIQPLMYCLSGLGLGEEKVGEERKGGARRSAGDAQFHQRQVAISACGASEPQQLGSVQCPQEPLFSSEFEVFIFGFILMHVF